ncbi:MAG: hypothetical protein Q4B64_05050 [Spirochaetales bacterium]|nr:hypothetical protein [Spirochaetales bacterium]
MIDFLRKELFMSDKSNEKTKYVFYWSGVFNKIIALLIIIAIFVGSFFIFSKSNFSIILHEKNNMFVFLCIYVVIAAAVISLLFYMIISDTDGIRFAKLNALMTLRQEFDKSKNFETVEETCEFCKFYKKANDEIPDACPRKVTKTKNLYGELTKTLMNSITEV